jgi:hypothetical protein
MEITFEFIQTLVAQPLFDDPTQAPQAAPHLNNGHTPALEEREEHHEEQGIYHEDSDPDIDQDEFFGGDI